MNAAAAGSFDYALSIELVFEGGDRVHTVAGDPGGTTKYGISARAYPEIDIAGLTYEAARAIYFDDYWRRSRAVEMPPAIALVVFDAAVNQGVGAAGKALQRALRAAGERVVIDGLIGSRTLAAVERVAAEGGDGRLLVYLLAWRAMAYTLAKPFQLFGRGWFNRLFAIALEAGRLLGDNRRVMP